MLPTHISRVAINAILDLLFPLLLTAAGGSREAAVQAALGLLAEYHPNSAEELGLAAEIIAFRNRALACLRASARPGASPAEVKDLEKTAAALRRQEAGAQRKLDALQRARRAAAKQAVKPQPQASPPPQPSAPADAAAAPATPQAAPPPVKQTPPAPAHAAASATPTPSGMDERIRRLTADLTGQAPDQRARTAAIGAALKAGDQHGLLRAIAGTAYPSVSAAALLHAG